MGTTVERVGKNGALSVQAKVRKNGQKLSQTFTGKDAKKQAEDWITTTEAKLITGVSVDGHKVRKTTLADIFDAYLKDGKVSKKKKGTIERLKVEIGKLTLEQFNTKALGKYIEIKLDQPIPEQARKKVDHPLYKAGKVVVDGKAEVRKNKPATVRHYYYAIRTALSWHAKINDYNFNEKPFSDNPPPSAWESPRERRVEDDELSRLMAACDQMYVHKQNHKDLINFQIYSCMRVGETLLMRWKDIFVDEKEPWASYIHVPREHQKTKKKKGSADREVSMQPALYELIMKNILPRKGKAKPEDRVFPFWKNSTVYGARFNVIRKNAKVADFNVHDFRHEGISLLFESTTLTDIEIAKITGHLELDTLKRYAKLRPKKTGAKLWAAFAPGKMEELKAA